MDGHVFLLVLDSMLLLKRSQAVWGGMVQGLERVVDCGVGP